MRYGRVSLLSIRRAANHQARVNAKHDLARAIERLVRQDGRPEAYVQELARWAKLVGYELEGVEIKVRRRKYPGDAPSGPSVDFNQKTQK